MNSRITALFILLFLHGCGGGSSATNSDQQNSSNAKGISAVETLLPAPGSVNGETIDGVWLLAQERDFDYQTLDARGNLTAAGRQTQFRADIITLQRNGLLIIARYCADGAKPLFEALLVDYLYFDVEGDGYFFPSRETFRGHIAGDGTRIEFTPGHFQVDQQQANGDIKQQHGQTTLRAYKLRDGLQSTRLGRWRTPHADYDITCATFRDMQDFPSIPSTAAATAHRTQALSLAAGNTTLKIDQQTLNGNTSVSLTQVIDAKQTWTGEQLDLFEWKSVHRLHYQGRYQAGDDPYIYGFDLRLDQ